MNITATKSIYVITCVASIMSFLMCKTAVYTPDTFPQEQIRFGFGGGFAGSLAEYCLLSNGQLFVRTAQNARWQTLESQDKLTTKRLFNQIQSQELKKIDHHVPGNMYKFIHIVQGDLTHKIVWCDEVPPKNTTVLTYYDILMHEVEGLDYNQSNLPER